MCFLSLFFLPTSLMSLSLLQEFFRNLSCWMDQHAAMNDAGNFLIETCDETVSLDLKQQLLLLNGRWRDLFLQVKQVNIIKLHLFCFNLYKSSACLNKTHQKLCVLPLFLQYAHSDEMEKWRNNHLKAVWTLKDLLDTAEAKLNAPVQVSFLGVRAFLQDVEVRI